jgi:hypothetical protein
MIGFRLSEEQYQTLQEASFTSGARCVSDYARDTLFEALNAHWSGTSPDGLEARVSQLVFNLQMLAGEIQRLRNVTARPGGETK